MYGTMSALFNVGLRDLVVSNIFRLEDVVCGRSRFGLLADARRDCSHRARCMDREIVVSRKKVPIICFLGEDNTLVSLRTSRVD